MLIFYVIPVSYNGRNSMNITFVKFIECISRGLTAYVTNRRHTFSDENQFLCYLFEFINFSKTSHQVCKGGSSLLML